jgi:hypothetical protein
MRHIYAWQVVAMIALLAAYIYYRRKEAAKRPPVITQKAKEEAEVRAAVERMVRPDESPGAVYERLRKEAFGMSPHRFSMAGEGKEDLPYGVIMEVGIPDSVVTLAGFVDGDARVYYQNGGGMVGGFAHESTREASKAFVAASSKVLPRLGRTAEQPPIPAGGKVRFSVLTARGIVTGEIDREALGDSSNAFSALYYSGQEVVAQMRQVQAKNS